MRTGVGFQKTIFSTQKSSFSLDIFINTKEPDGTTFAHYLIFQYVDTK